MGYYSPRFTFYFHVFPFPFTVYLYLIFFSPLFSVLYSLLYTFPLFFVVYPLLCFPSFPFYILYDFLICTIFHFYDVSAFPSVTASWSFPLSSYFIPYNSSMLSTFEIYFPSYLDFMHFLCLIPCSPLYYFTSFPAFSISPLFI